MSVAHLSKKLKGNTACDLRFEELVFYTNCRGTLLAIRDLGSSFVQKLKGDTFDLGFGELICQKN